MEKNDCRQKSNEPILQNLAMCTNDAEKKIIADYKRLLENNGIDKVAILNGYEAIIGNDEYTRNLYIEMCEAETQYYNATKAECDEVVVEKHAFGSWLDDSAQDTIDEIMKEDLRIPASRSHVFAQKLVDIMHRNGITNDAEIYKSVGMSKSNFYRLKQEGTGTKEEVWRLIFGLQCDLKDAIEILQIAGFAIMADKSFYHDLEQGAYDREIRWDLAGVYDEFDKACLRCIEDEDYDINNLKHIQSLRQSDALKKVFLGIAKSKGIKRHVDIYQDVGMSKSVYYSLLTKGTGTKEEVWRLIFGLHCNLKEAIRILRVTGYGISADKSFYNNLENGTYVSTGWDLSGVYDAFDRACLRCIEYKEYNIYSLNEMLLQYGLKELNENVYVNDDIARD